MLIDPNQSHRASGEDGRLLSASSASDATASRLQQLAALRQAVSRIEHKQAGFSSAGLSLGIATVARHLPESGLSLGVLHEIIAAEYRDRPSAFGFALALMEKALTTRPGPAMLVLTHRATRDFGRPYAHGLRQHGIDPRRVVIIETRDDKDAHWALEEALRSNAHPAIVMATLAGDLDLTVSRRLNLAAAAHNTLLAVIRLAGATGTSAAATRWNISAAPGMPEGFGSFGRSSWRAKLERCRNGRPGEWRIEWNHGSHCFCLVESVADSTPASFAATSSAR